NVDKLVQIARYERQSNYLLSDQIQMFFTQDNRVLYYDNGDSLVTVHLETGEQDTFPLPRQSTVPVAPSFAISPDNQWLLADSSGDFGGVFVYNFHTQQQVAFLPCSGGLPLKIQFSPIDNNLFAVITNENVAHYLDFWRIRPTLPNPIDEPALEQWIKDCKP